MPYESASTSESTAIAAMKKALGGFETEDGRLKGLDYQPGPRDVVITTTPKAGTTWAQQICHQLRTGGDMDFEEISQVVPWLELAHDQGQDLTAKQWGDAGGHLRFFKTHAWAGDCPPFPKTIVVLRDPCDVVVSFWRFFEGSYLYSSLFLVFHAFHSTERRRKTNCEKVPSLTPSDNNFCDVRLLFRMVFPTRLYFTRFLCARVLVGSWCPLQSHAECVLLCSFNFLV